MKRSIKSIRAHYKALRMQSKSAEQPTTDDGSHEGKPCEQGVTAAKTGCVPASGEYAAKPEPLEKESNKQPEPKPKREREGAGSRLKQILREAEQIQITDDVIEYEEEVEQDDYDAIEEGMSRDQRRDMEIALEDLRNEIISEMLDNYEPNVDGFDPYINEASLLEEEGYAPSDMEDKMKELINEYIQDDEEKKAMTEAISGLLPRRRAYGVDALDGLISEVEAVGDIPREMSEQLNGYRDEIEYTREQGRDTAYEEQEEEYIEEQKQEYRDNLEQEYDDSSDRREYLRNFFRDNKAQYSHETTKCPDKSWCKDVDGDGIYKFNTKKGETYKVAAVNRKVRQGYGELSGKEVPDLQFSDQYGRFGITGSGGAFEIFSKVVPALVAYVQKKDIPVATFSAAEESRQKLYDRLVTTVAESLPEYAAVAVVNGDTKYYVLMKRDLKETATDFLAAYAHLPREQITTLVKSLGVKTTLPAFTPMWWTQAAW